MATVLNSTALATDWLKWEEDNYFSRETGTLASGSGVVTTGTVLAKVTASGKWVPAVNSAADGSQTAAGILFNDSVDATSADQKIIVVSRHAIVSHAGLTYGASINDATKRATAHGQLAAVGIRVREGA